MCFYIRNTEEARTLWVAKEDIVCYKTMVNYNSKVATSRYKNFIYILGRVYKQKLEKIPKVTKEGLYIFPVVNGVWRTVSLGFHSYSTCQEARRNTGMWNTFSVYRCIIPKGSEFYYDRERKEYISNQIKIVKKLT